MNEAEEYNERVSAIHLLRSGISAKEVAEQLGKSLAWVYKWRKRYFEKQDWKDLSSHSRAPHRSPKRISAGVRAKIKMARSQLEKEAQQPHQLSYIGGYAVQNRLKQQSVTPLPSRTSIERILSAEKMTRPRTTQEIKIPYPHLHPTQSHQLTQIDIVPRYLPGGGCVSCFNAIDVISRYPSGWQALSKRSQDAVQFVLQALSELGIAEYTQLDNEACFSGGFTHPGVIGKVTRLLLYVGSQPVFSPFYMPESNAIVERFHQDYLKNTWEKEDMPDLPAVQANSAPFFELYRQSGHHSALNGATPASLHQENLVLHLPPNFQLPCRLPLTVGKMHFIRIVQADQTISVANLTWKVPTEKVLEGVWVTVEITMQGATLRIYDAAPDIEQRNCLAAYPFPLNEPVQPLRPEFLRPIPVPISWWQTAIFLLRSEVLKRLPDRFSTMS